MTLKRIEELRELHTVYRDSEREYYARDCSSLEWPVLQRHQKALKDALLESFDELMDAAYKGLAPIKVRVNVNDRLADEYG